MRKLWGITCAQGCHGDAQKWASQLGAASPLHSQHSGGDILVLINGVSKKATDLFNTIVFPMLDKAGVPFVAEKTVRRGKLGTM